jgi:hypothetical protein
VPALLQPLPNLSGVALDLLENASLILLETLFNRSPFIIEQSNAWHRLPAYLRLTGITQNLSLQRLDVAVGPVLLKSDAQRHLHEGHATRIVDQIGQKLDTVCEIPDEIGIDGPCH